eukprot:g15969.t1
MVKSTAAKIMKKPSAVTKSIQKKVSSKPRLPVATSSDLIVKINRAPVLTLWITVCMRRLGYKEEIGDVTGPPKDPNNLKIPADTDHAQDPDRSNAFTDCMMRREDAREPFLEERRSVERRFCTTGPCCYTGAVCCVGSSGVDDPSG